MRPYSSLAFRDDGRMGGPAKPKDSLHSRSHSKSGARSSSMSSSGSAAVIGIDDHSAMRLERERELRALLGGGAVPPIGTE